MIDLSKWSDDKVIFRKQLLATIAIGLIVGFIAGNILSGFYPIRVAYKYATNKYQTFQNHITSEKITEQFKQCNTSYDSFKKENGAHKYTELSIAQRKSVDDAIIICQNAFDFGRVHQGAGVLNSIDNDPVVIYSKIEWLKYYQNNEIVLDEHVNEWLGSPKQQQARANTIIDKYGKELTEYISKYGVDPSKKF